MSNTVEDELDELDDLDDILDEFNAPAPSTSTFPSKPAPQPSTIPKASTSAPTSAAAAGAGASLPSLPEDDEFAQQLQAGMEDFMRSLEEDPETRKEFETLMKQMGDMTAGAGGADSNKPPKSPAPPTPSSETGPGTKKTFQETIQATMGRMKSSDQEAKESIEGSETDAFLAEMMAQLSSTAGSTSEEDFLTSMMSQLLSRSILYEPLHELSTSYPAWIASHTSDPKIDIYKKQAEVVRQIVEEFDRQGYSDEDAEAREKVLGLMMEMQEMGSPPVEIMGDAGELGALGMGGLPGTEGKDCVIM
ncbi:Peroxisome chaperone and import receptor [Saitoella coloradoensis]